MSCCGAATLAHQGQDDPSKRIDFHEDQLRQGSRVIDENLMQTSFTVPDMHCAGCIGKIERGLAKLDSVSRVRANLSLKRVTVVWDRQNGNATEIDRALSQLGFEHSIFDLEETSSGGDGQRGRDLLLALAVAGFASANIMLLSVSVWSGANEETAQLFHLISGLIAVPTVAYSGQPFFKSAWTALRAMRMNMDVPISLAVILALLMSLYESLTGGSEAYFDAAVTLLFFLLIGRYLDHLMRQKARGAVEQLARMSSRGAIHIDESGEASFLPTSEIQKGMKLRLKPGERFPVDGEVVTGATDIDRSLVTGESDHVSVGVGEVIEAGALNLTGVIDIKATSTAEDSFLAEMHKMMEVAENGRNQYVRIADRMAQIYAPAVHLLALVTFLTWMVISGGDFHTSIYYAIAVLIITCPCALGLAVPVAHVVGANRLMRQGVMMRDGSALERLAEIDTVVFDKTGTLTSGSPTVIGMTNYHENNVGLYKAMAACSSHPFSKALYKLFEDADDIELTNIIEKPGFGVEANYAGKKVRFGKPVWALNSHESLPADQTKSCVVLAVQNEDPVLFELEDSLRSGAKTSVRCLKKNGYDVKILSGDRMEPVSSIADVLGVDDFQANLTPAGKIKALDELKNEGQKTLMVGDGLNDAPALASAHVSMAPSSACDVGRLTSDFIFIKPSLDAVVSAHETSLVVSRVITQNFAIALAYNCIAVPLAMMGYVTPLIAALAMSGSSIVVIANSLRINFGLQKPERTEDFKTKEVLVS